MPLSNENDIRMQLAGIDLTDFEESLSDAGLDLSRLIDEQVLPQAESFIQHYCHRSFEQQTSTELFAGTGRNTLATGLYPIQQVTNCTIKVTPGGPWYTFANIRNINCINSEGQQVATPTTPAELERADLHVSCRDGLLIIPPTIMGLSGAIAVHFPAWNWTWINMGEHVHNIEVTLVWGFTEVTVPASIRAAVAALCALLILPKIDSTMTSGVKSWRLGDESRTWGSAAGALIADPLFAPFMYGGIYSTQAASMLATVASTLPQHRRVVI